jgi:hypothetical protein
MHFLDIRVPKWSKRDSEDQAPPWENKPFSSRVQKAGVNLGICSCHSCIKCDPEKEDDSQGGEVDREAVWKAAEGRRKSGGC